MRVPRQPAYHRDTPPRGSAERRARRCRPWWSWWSASSHLLRGLVAGARGPGGFRRPDGPDGRRRWFGRRWLRWVAFALAALLLTGAGLGWALLRRLDGNLTADVETAAELERRAAERPPPAPGEALNVLLIGTDPADSTAETVILLHLAGDRESATAAAFPGELPVELPDCTGRDAEDGSGNAADETADEGTDETADETVNEGADGSADRGADADAAEGGPAEPARVPFERAYQVGGAACTIRTLEELTGIRMDHHLIIDVEGFQRIVEAIGGPAPCPAPASGDLLAGQREFLEQLVRKVSDEDLLRNPAKLLPVLDAAAASITTDTELDSVVKIYDLVHDVQGVPAEAFELLTVPTASAAASQLYQRLRQDRPVLPGAASDDGKAPSVTGCE
ncbi:LCP family protein [Streptomyces sp. B6B3]|uniref:LCP family protein n=1 Tax=Streptomyces sp. B6B3 TaxID=3153570 RepID=UPI00325D0817